MKAMTVVAAVVLFGGCTDDENRPAVCDSYDTVQASADDLRNANIGENGLTLVRTDLQDLRQSLEQLLDDARALYQPQVDAITVAVEQLATTVTAARAEPTAMTLLAVGDAAAWLRETVHRLGTAMADTC
jgi:hypothetical protein